MSTQPCIRPSSLWTGKTTAQCETLQNQHALVKAAGKRHSPLTICSPWIPCRSYSDSCFLDSPLYPELADVQWYGQEKAKPGTLV